MSNQNDSPVRQAAPIGTEETTDPSLSPAPEDVAIWGVDVSEFQPLSLDWAELVRNGCAFAVLRGLTGGDRQGIMRADHRVRQHADNARGAGVEFVAVYAWTVEGRDGAAQARAFVDATSGIDPIFYAHDHEPPPKKTRWVDNARATQVAQDFVIETEQLTGKTCVVYTAPYALRAAPLVDGTRPLWLASPGTIWPAKVPAPWTEITIWQDGIQKVRGIDIDHNVFRGSRADFARRLGLV